ncbi:MAG: hypothetical protein PHU85_18795 [Phycisphaerae bacterium]|nr:hypothetical protein [Phycisphaerae bacterium]
MKLTTKRQTRKLIADFVRRGHSIPQAQERFHVTASQVYVCLREHAVVPPARKSDGVYTAIAMMQEGSPPPDVAGRLNVSTAYIYAIRQRCRRAGVKIDPLEG